MNDEELYVHRDSVTSYADINRELARYFSCTGAQTHCLPDSVLQQSSRCMRQLKFVLVFLLVFYYIVIIGWIEKMSPHRLFSVEKNILHFLIDPNQQNEIF